MHVSNAGRLPTWRGARGMTAHEIGEPSAQVGSRRRQRQLADRTGHPPARRAAKLSITPRIIGFEDHATMPAPERPLAGSAHVAERPTPFAD